MAIGTTANEQLHQELNNIFDNVHEIHRPVLEVKLRILLLYKLLPHTRAMFRSASRQVSQQLLLSRMVADLRPWTNVSWGAWCESLVHDGFVSCANLPLARQRRAHALQLKQWRARVCKKPASAVRSNRKRTAFTKLTGLRALLRSMPRKSKAEA